MESRGHDFLEEWQTIVAQKMPQHRNFYLCASAGSRSQASMASAAERTMLVVDALLSRGLITQRDNKCDTLSDLGFLRTSSRSFNTGF